MIIYYEKEVKVVPEPVKSPNATLAILTNTIKKLSEKNMLEEKGKKG